MQQACCSQTGTSQISRKCNRCRRRERQEATETEKESGRMLASSAVFIDVVAVSCMRLLFLEFCSLFSVDSRWLIPFVSERRTWLQSAAELSRPSAATNSVRLCLQTRMHMYPVNMFHNVSVGWTHVWFHGQKERKNPTYFGACMTWSSFFRSCVWNRMEWWDLGLPDSGIWPLWVAPWNDWTRMSVATQTFGVNLKWQDTCTNRISWFRVSVYFTAHSLSTQKQRIIDNACALPKVFPPTAVLASGNDCVILPCVWTTWLRSIEYWHL